MQPWQQFIIFIYGLLACIAFITSFRATYVQKKAYDETPLFGFLFTGFVHADNVIFGLFWLLVCSICLISSNWLLFLLFLSTFWLVRSVGETMYWFLQQFHPRGGNEPDKFWHHKIFHNDSVWFINQIFWQCITVITLITTISLVHLWLR